MYVMVTLTHVTSLRVFESVKYFKEDAALFTDSKNGRQFKCAVSTHDAHQPPVDSLSAEILTGIFAKHLQCHAGVLSLGFRLGF